CSNEERKYLVQIEQLLGFHIPRAIDNPLQSVHEEPLPTQIGKKMEVRNKGNSRAESNKRTGKKRSRRFKGTDKPKKSKKSFSKNESRSRNPNI
ncbi:MAG: hypothetical protein ACW99A_21115, partial [Candidatus Kariarchaeaceae archaeon]